MSNAEKMVMELGFDVVDGRHRPTIKFILAPCHADDSAAWNNRDMLGKIMRDCEQHQGEPVALPKRLPVRMPEGRNLTRGYAQAWNDCIAEVEKLGPLYAHADSGEVERLRAVAEHFTGVSIKATEEVSTLRAKLAEREALLRAALQDCMDIEIMRSMRGSIYINRLSDRIKQALGNGEENDK